MDTPSVSINADTDAPSAELASWNRPRTSEELRNFVNSHHAMLPDSISIN
jgi:hypothetical protein